MSLLPRYDEALRQNDVWMLFAMSWPIRIFSSSTVHVLTSNAVAIALLVGTSGMVNNPVIPVLNPIIAVLLIPLMPVSK